MNFAFVLIDMTTDATPSELRPTSEKGFMLMQAWMEQIMGPFTKEWGAQLCTMRYGSESDRDPTDIAVHFRDSIPEAPGALAFHQVVNGVPDIELGCDLFSSWADSGDSSSLSVGGSHELLELLGDPGANRWADLQDQLNRTRAMETADRVQNTCYPACNGYPVTNFVNQSFFIPGASGPYDYMGALTDQNPPQSGDKLGYEVIGDSPNNIQQVTGMHGLTLKPGKRMIYLLGDIPDRKKRRRPFSRTYRRGVRL